MPNDAKLGLLCGVGIVIAVSVVFFRNEGSSASPAGNATAASVGSPKVTPAPLTPAVAHPPKAKPTAAENDSARAGRRDPNAGSR